MSGQRSLRPLWALFFCTGLTGLLLEQSFERWLSTVVGTSRQSSAIVLALYFVGLAVGARLFGPLSRRIKNGIRLYAFLEACVGIYALVLGLFPDTLLRGSTALLASAPPDSLGSLAVRVLIGALWILPPTLAMGATFPAVVRALEQNREGRPIASRMSSLYSANLLGAVTAALLAPYLFFAYLGVHGALRMVVLFQAVIVATALWLARKQRLVPPSPQEAPASPDDGAEGAAPQSAKAVVALAFFSGFIIFSYEVAWVHLIGAAIGMSAFSFALMLVCVLLGLGLASAYIARVRAQEKSLPNHLLGYAFLAAAGAGLLSFLLWDRSSLILMLFGAGATGFFQGELARLATAVVILLPSAWTLGMVFPLLFRIAIFPRERAAQVSSQMSMANAIGSMVGALGTGFILLNLMGAENILRLLSALLALAAAVAMGLWWRGSKEKRARRRSLLSLLGAVALLVIPLVLPGWNYLALLSGINVYFHPGHVLSSDEIVFQGEDNVSGYTTVVARQGKGENPTLHTLLTNGKFQGNDTGEVTAQISFAYLPAVYAPKREKALVIGLGTGASASAIAAAGFEQTDIAELSPTIPKAAQLFTHINRNLFELPGVRLHVEDGRTHLARCPARTYDAMSMELSSVWFAGSTNLYSYEFYTLARERLKQDGVFQQWVQLHHIGVHEIFSIIATLRAAFPHVQLHFVGEQGILLASESPLILSRQRADELARDLGEAFKSFSGAMPRLGADMVSSTMVLDSEDASRLLQQVQQEGLTINNDKNRYLEYWSPRYNLEQRDLVKVNLKRLLQFVDPEDRRDRARAFGLRWPLDAPSSRVADSP